ncbi:MAG TPA: hypothetical protein DCR93_24120, partial [Cytophagales bacterium]|nr:hypothetical protein [Cytophagales bacterium]
MKKLLLLCLFCSTSLGLWAQRSSPFPDALQRLPLERKANPPSALLGMGYATDGKYLYSWGGSNAFGSITNALYRYDPEQDKWKKMPVNGEVVFRRYGRLVHLPEQNQLLVIGGECLTTARRSISCYDQELYDLETNTIQRFRGPINPGPNPGVAYWDGSVYIGGSKGIPSGFYSDSLYRFEPATGHWYVEGSLPLAMETAATIIDGVYITLGGYAGGRRGTQGIYGHVLGSNSWKLFQSLSEPLSAHAVAVHENLVFLVSDFQHGNYLRVLDVDSNRIIEYFDGRLARHCAAAVL